MFVEKPQQFKVHSLPQSLVDEVGRIERCTTIGATM